MKFFLCPLVDSMATRKNKGAHKRQITAVAGVWIELTNELLKTGSTHSYTKISEVSGSSRWAYCISSEVSCRKTKSVTTGSAWSMPTLAETAVTQGAASSFWWITACIVAQIAFFSIFLVQAPMYSLGSNGRRDRTSVSMLDLPGQCLISKLKLACSATRRCPTVDNLAEDSTYVNGLLSV